MAATPLTFEEAQAAQIELVTGRRATQAVHDVVTAIRANRRSGTAHAKTRGEVAGSNRKPWRQKGTGRARAGRVTSPIWRGGGVVFGPRARSYAKAVNKSTRKLALRAVLGSRIEAGDVLLVPDFAVEDRKTKSFLQQLGAVVDTMKVLVISDQFEPNTYFAARNVAPAQLITASEVNVEQLLGYDKIIVTQNALPILARRTQK